MKTDRDIIAEREGRLSGLRTDRYSWWVHWSELGRYLLPRRYRWLVTPNQMNRGAPMNGAILDSTGTMAARVLSSGMMSGITSPTRPWFKLRMEGYQADQINSVNLWLAECEKRMMRVFQESNFYNSIAIVYADLAVFGTGVLILDEDYEDVIHCSNPALGEFYLANDDRGYAGVMYREMTLTVEQIVNRFGIDNVSDDVRRAYESKDGASLTKERWLCHAVERNRGEVADRFEYVSVYWERGATNGKLLERRGYFECPFIAPRWDVSGNDAYGRSPGMDALGDVKQLQQETKRKAQVIDKMANPPLAADVELKNQPASSLPGGITYLTKKDGLGIKPVYENFRPPVQELMLDIKEVQERIRSAFFNDLFLMISQLDTVRTATEIDARREEKLIMLGPVLERFQTEALDKAIDRTFAIMNRAGLLPPPPAEIQGQPIQIEYVSMLAEAQRAVSASGVERALAFAGNLVAVDRTVLDNFNLDEVMTGYSAMMSVPPTMMNTPETREKLRQARQQQEAQAASAQTAMAAVKGAKTLSETEVGGGKSALENMLAAGGMPA